MSAWKQFERDCAALIGGNRFWANSGERFDVESDRYIAQCKLVQRMSLAALTDLANEAEAHASERGKIGLVFAKVRLGRGVESPTLVVLTEAAWRRFSGL